ncbi:MAG: epoxyqueuosine reductase QueH [Planctomycetota bacterium]|nr:epoxyqueuosine reductase QueH [Planctomycetota bacterium]MDI6788606.1 epoxyqueuosine reductase QueH [Planctomycetota bacterium]
MTNLLLHICCGVCASGLIEKFRKDGYKIAGFFYNPNIHPYKEFLKRLRAVEMLSETEEIPVFYERNYGLIEFLSSQSPDNLQWKKEPNLFRCARCYEMRLSRTADIAREHNFPVFSSTLIISPCQNQLLIKNIGENIAQSKEIVFKYERVTELYPQCVEFARKRQLYRQQYCGCIFSEYERYRAYSV